VPITDKKLTNMEIYRQYVPGAEPVRWRGSRLSCGLRKLFAVALLALLPGVAAAQASASPPDLAIVSIDDLVSTTLIHNPALKAAERGVDAATAAVVSAGALPNPRLELNGGRNAISSSGSITGIGVSQLIENPALRQARVSGALYAQQGSQQSVAATRNELVAQVRLRAYEYLLRRLQAQEAAESLQLLEQIRERIKVRVDTGETGKLDLIRSDAEIVNASQREKTARLQIVQAATTLNRLAAGMLPPRWELDAELDDTVVLPPLEQLKQEATRLNPEVRLLEAELSRTRSRIDEANASLLPGVELVLVELGLDAAANSSAAAASAAAAAAAAAARSASTAPATRSSPARAQLFSASASRAAHFSPAALTAASTSLSASTCLSARARARASCAAAAAAARAAFCAPAASTAASLALSIRLATTASLVLRACPSS
jgi:hypothetical protein